jgi:hypothetical protein
MSRMTTDERTYASDPSNFKSQNEYQEYADEIRKGDEAHMRCDYWDEATRHRPVQENIYGSGFDRQNNGSKHDFAWNSLYMHSPVTMRMIHQGGIGFNDALYYDQQKCHYYLTESGRNHCDVNGISYHTKGVTSLVHPSGNYPTQCETRKPYEGSESVNYGFGIEKKSVDCAHNCFNTDHQSNTDQQSRTSYSNAIPKFSGDGDFSDQDMQRMTEQVMKQMSRF